MAYDNLKLEKGLYTTGKSFTQALEQIDFGELRRYPAGGAGRLSASA